MLLELKDLKKTFQSVDQKIQVLRGVNASIQKSEIVAILGQSGSGKSTLLSLLAGLDIPDSGEVRLGGINISGLNQAAITQFRGQNIGFVFQQFHLMSHLTALENVMLPLEILRLPNPKQQATEVLAKMKLGHRLDHFPSQLSGGECQRVAIARALTVKPKILLADEPSGNLDVETGAQVMKEFFGQLRSEGLTAVIVTHSPTVADQCDRKLTLSGGLLG